MRDILKQLKSMGKTILISSHILPELAEMCDEIGVIDNGKLIAHGSVAAIQTRLQGEKVLTVKLKNGFEKAISFFEEDPFVTGIETGEQQLSFRYRGSDEEQMELLKKQYLQIFLYYHLRKKKKI